jgi:hypothetical protein
VFSALITRNLTIITPCLQNDTQLVSILYRTHKSLPTAAKVSSLYAFDALARAARSQVTKHGLTGDINYEKGNCATFLLKIEGVLDGLFQDMVTAGIPEAKVSCSSTDLFLLKGRLLARSFELLPIRHCVMPNSVLVTRMSSTRNCL